MEAYQLEQLHILLESMILMIRYQLRDKEKKRSIWNKLRLLRQRDFSEIRKIYQDLQQFRDNINESGSYQENFLALIKLLDNYRYYFSVQVQKDYLLEKILNAMIGALFFTEAHVAAYKSLVLEQNAIPLYLQELAQEDLLAQYEQFYKKEHSVLGRRIDRLKISDIELIAKQGMINGKLFELLGEAGIIQYGLKYTQKELQAILNKNHFPGFLTKERIESYADKIVLLKKSPPPFLSPPIPPIEPQEETLIKNARYLVEDIMNACGVTTEDRAQYPEHQFLVKACFWVDEMFKGVKAGVAPVLLE